MISITRVVIIVWVKGPRGLHTYPIYHRATRRPPTSLHVLLMALTTAGSGALEGCFPSRKNVSCWKQRHLWPGGGCPALQVLSYKLHDEMDGRIQWCLEGCISRRHRMEGQPSMAGPIPHTLIAWLASAMPRVWLSPELYTILAKLFSGTDRQNQWYRYGIERVKDQ